MSFESRLLKLNQKQRQAVDLIDGPVMVVAGPGTGKTELLSMRAANILNQTDTAPENILCLTFTDSGADAMRSRLVEIIGQNAYKIAVHTFHSFGTEVINQNSQFFYGGADFKPTDELTSYQLLKTIFDELEHSNPLASKMNDEFVSQKKIQKLISQLKKSGLTSSELLEILESNKAIIDLVQPQLGDVFAIKINKETSQKLKPIVEILQALDLPALPENLPNYAELLLSSLSDAVGQAEAVHPTKSITKWKNQWMQKNKLGEFILKSSERQIKLRAAIGIYESYLARMQEAQLFDFDDMILQVVHGLETQPELRFNVQEKYQYIMVDEFQDTNMAQTRILHNLTDNPVNEGKPNIMVVGDDDQAIFSFQGADVSNILSFEKTYPETQLITLTDNYRSVEPILKAAREVIVQGIDRLENHIDALDKSLVAHNQSENQMVVLKKFQTKNDEYQNIVSDIKARIQSGEEPSSIAVLTRQHKEIVALLPHFHDADISVNYEKQDNVLDSDLIILTERIAKTILLLVAGEHSRVDSMMPKLIAHPAWGFAAESMWKLSLAAFRERKTWLEIMAVMPEFAPLQKWFLKSSQLVNSLPLEQFLDRIIGVNQEQNDELVSPLFEHFFSEEKMQQNPSGYIDLLDALRTVRAKLREHQPNQTPNLQTFVDFIEIHAATDTPIMSIRKRQRRQVDAVNLLTAHKSKGLEFDTVFVVGCVDKTWGEKASLGSDPNFYPENLELAPAGGTLDERLRLFFVAMTRAKKNLILSYSTSNDSGKESLKASFLVPIAIDEKAIEATSDPDQQLAEIKLQWYAPLLAPDSKSLKELLAPTLENYKLSATHLNSFLDVTRGGPQHFLISNILHFPSAMSPHATFGSAVHTTLQRAHNHLKASGSLRPVEDVLHDFEIVLSEYNLPADESEFFLQKGIDVLKAFLDEKYDSFHANQKVELNFAHQNVVMSGAHLKGALDLVEIDEPSKTIRVIDYKTGKPIHGWSGGTENEKLKAHKYKQQLMFYKLLVENSRDFGKYKVDSAALQFVEPSVDNKIICLDLEFDAKELENFQKLVLAVWKHIKDFTLPDTSSYSANLKGVLAFEADLLSEDSKED